MKLKSPTGRVYTTKDRSEITRLKASGYTEVKDKKAAEPPANKAGK